MSKESKIARTDKQALPSFFLSFSYTQEVNIKFKFKFKFKTKNYFSLQNFFKKVSLVILLSKLYFTIYNVILVGLYNGLECYNHSYYKIYKLLSYFELNLGSFRVFGLHISGLTGLRLGLGLETSRAASFCAAVHLRYLKCVQNLCKKCKK
jgi:hypothetical protein